ncbi:hypothetical protein [Streptomyces noursei]|nr:hypothetical protein [Streptomyces noursei]GGW89466.1 hypothetical protein GCM10010341_07860 [Streptomyces noursei]
MLLTAMDESASWSPGDYLMARVSDAMELSNFLFLKANSTEADELKPPTPIPRPGESEPETRKADHEFATGEELASFFSRMSSM